MSVNTSVSTSQLLMKRIRRILAGLGCSSVALLFSGVIVIILVVVIVGAAQQGSTGGDSSSNSAINEYREEVLKYSIKYGLEPAFIYAIIETESNFNSNASSPAGAKGLMQIMPATFEEMKKQFALDGEEDDGYTFDNILEPEVNIKYGVRYCKYIKDMFPQASVKTWAAAYNAGPFAVQGWLSNSLYSSDGIDLIYEKIPYGETKAYVQKVYASYQNFGNADGQQSQGGGEIVSGGVSESGYMWPVPTITTITSGFGSRWGSSHNGIDISDGSSGEQIVAAKDGTVTVAYNSCPNNYPKSGYCSCGRCGNYGNHCYILHSDGSVTRYAHMTTCYVTVGQEVKQGEVIGTIGTTGWSTGNHLHFELHIGGVPVDPEPYLK